jgi:hypothetical protein
MAAYRLLVDHYVGTTYCEAGSVVSDSGPGAILPIGWIPTTACDPTDVQGVQNFWNAGPRGQSDADPLVVSRALAGRTGRCACSLLGAAE